MPTQTDTSSKESKDKMVDETEVKKWGRAQRVALNIEVERHEEIRSAAIFAVKAFTEYLENEHQEMARFYRPDAERATSELIGALDWEVDLSELYDFL